MERRRRRLTVTGTVQGVGFRPFVVRLANAIGITGSVGNDAQGVWCEVQGDARSLARFVDQLRSDAPPLARIDAIETADLPVRGAEVGFEIAASDSASTALTTTVPADAAPCRRCTEEVFDPANRRFGYAFTCCTDCGPRFTVVDAIPYDRARTSMVDFPLCPACDVEYGDPSNRRFHGQAICCSVCGPSLTLAIDGEPYPGDALLGAAEVVRSGRVLALKGVGGYQLVCRADIEESVKTLRARKQREEKPFALLVDSVEVAKGLIDLDLIGERAITGTEAPIVLAPRAVDAAARVAASVAPGTELLGVMLPASPLHALLAAALAPIPLVCTSGNRSDEPIVTDDDRLATDLGPIADAVLAHDRRIARRADDSIGRVIAGDFQLLRRARGFAPRPIRLDGDGPTVLAVGAELKNTVCLAVGAAAHMSAHLGDLEHPAAIAGFEQAIADLLVATGAEPAVVVHDLHPEYLSTKFATSTDLAPALAVQHHHAHLVSCLVDNQRTEPAIGVIFDGLGWGSDGTLWGGEVLVGDASAFTRFAHLNPISMPGGAVAIREPWRMALAHMTNAFADEAPPLAVFDRHVVTVPTVLRQLTSSATMQTSSMGRLFDAVASMCGLADKVTFEGQAAVMLEQAAGEFEARYAVELTDTAPTVVVTAGLIRSVVDDLSAQVAIDVIAGRFHRWVGEVIVELVSRAASRHGMMAVVLSGGVFQNRKLTEWVAARLRSGGFEVLLHRQVPPNDGGISLGQAAIGQHMAATSLYS